MAQPAYEIESEQAYKIGPLYYINLWPEQDGACRILRGFPNHSQAVYAAEWLVSQSPAPGYYARVWADGRWHPSVQRFDDAPSAWQRGWALYGAIERAEKVEVVRCPAGEEWSAAVLIRDLAV